VVWPKTRKRRWRLVVLLNRKDPANPRFVVLGSTDPTLHGHKLIDLYAARFQIEFLFRDSKQFTGLLDCQARAASALDFHCNASLASWKQCHFNERLLDVCMEKFALAPTWVKNHACYDELRTYGAIAA